MSPVVVFVDTETTSLRPDRRAWEIGLIVRRPDRPDVERQWMIETGGLDLGNADPASLRIGRFYERHPQMLGSGRVEAEIDVLWQVEQLTRGAHLVGCVPNFDTEVLAARMRAHGICPSWHYHLVDVKALAVGYLAGRAATEDQVPGVVQLPWNSDDLSRALGVTPDEASRHTALGDARWARDLYDAVMAGISHPRPTRSGAPC